MPQNARFNSSQRGADGHAASLGRSRERNRVIVPVPAAAGVISANGSTLDSKGIAKVALTQSLLFTVWSLLSGDAGRPGRPRCYVKIDAGEGQ